VILECLFPIDEDHWNFFFELFVCFLVVEDVDFTQRKGMAVLKRMELRLDLFTKTTLRFAVKDDFRHWHKRRMIGDVLNQVKETKSASLEIEVATAFSLCTTSPRHVINHPMMNGFPLAGQVALVTGAGRRIGRVIALALARAGADVVVNYNRSRAEALKTVREINALGVRGVAIRADISKPAQVRAMFRGVEKQFRRLDLLVNNAGIFFPAKWDKLTEEDWDRILGVNLKGPFFCAQAAARIMQRQKRGRIINISSLGGLEAWPSYMHYCASKAGVIMLTRCLAKALAPHVLVNSVAPGSILFPDERSGPWSENVIRTTPLRKAGRPEDIAEMVLYLATRADFITGQVFAVDGGKSIP